MNKIPSLLALFLAFVLWSNSTLATTFTVSNLSRYDSWNTPVAGSLRKALEDAAAAGVGPHTIVFNFGALGANPVFTFTGDEYINNTSSFALAGTNVTLDGLTGRPVGGSVTFTSAPYAGNAVFVMKGTNNTIKGITFTETTNIGYGLLVTGSGHTVQQNNFINGTGMGLRLNNTSNAIVQNNLVENNAQGGMFLDGSNNGALIGGCTVGNANTIIRNGYSASIANDDVGNGITLGGQFATCTASAGSPIVIKGNYIGTTSSFNFQDGSSNFLGNSHHGISIWQASNVTVGGTCPNYVCNNGFRRIASGISLYASNTVTVDGNIIGTDGTTGKKLGNDYDGVTINAAANNTITNNIIGNSVNGIGIRNTIGSPGVQPVGNIISNNKIGFDNSGNFISTSTSGISIEGNATTTLIQSNTIKASGQSFSYGNGQTNPVSSQGVGIYFQGSAGNTLNSVFLNTIGRQSADPAGANNVGNAILITGSTNNLIGDVSKGNIIGSNGTTSDIVVDGASAIRNKITYNQFVCNGSYATKGIELTNSGNINFGNTALVFVDMNSSGTITGGAPANSTIHVYTRTANCNQCTSATTGNYSRGGTFLGTTTTNGSGIWSFVTAQPASNIVVTATDGNNNTSEFSYCNTPLGICPTAAAGPDQTICNLTTATLAGNDPSTDGGVGAWTVISGTGVATTPASPTSGVTGLTVGSSTTFRWTVTKAGCLTTFDDVIITVSAPVSAAAGSAQTICNTTTATLAGSNPSPGTGLWTKTSGTGSITSPTVSNSGVTGLTVGASSTFQWTVTNGACTANSSVTITVSSPVTSNAGPDQTICNTTTTTLAATVPSPGAGVWTRTGGTGTVTTPASATSGVTGLTVGASSAFQWTVTNGACSANTTVTIFVSAPVSSNAGSAQTLCNVTTATLGATTPGTGTGAWSTTSGTGVVTTPSSETSGVTGLTIGASSTFQWTVTNGACSANSSVTITVSSPVSTTTSSQSICNSTTATLTASGTGTWAIVSGTGAVTTPSSATSGVTGLTVGSSSVFEWTVTVGGCTGVQERTTITVSSGAIADAGSDIGLCNATTTTLGATGTGTWTKVSGDGVITTPSDPASGVTGLTPGTTSVFQWTVDNGACSANASVNVVNTAPAVLNVGADFTTCLSSFPLTAFDPGVGYTGTWTSTNGSIVFTPANDPKAIVSGFTSGLNTLTWTVTGTGNCAGPYTVSLNITFGSSDLSVKLKAPDDTACVSTPRTLVAKAQGGSGNYKYVWVSNLDINHPAINANAIVDTTNSATYEVLPKYNRNLYWVFVIDKNNVGCSTPFSPDTVFASLGQDLNVPNLITPNDDGKNDYWVLKDKVTQQDILPGARFDLYNRWGDRIFTMDSYDNRFNAPHVSDGVYYYYVKSGCGGNEYKGWLQILGNNNP